MSSYHYGKQDVCRWVRENFPDSSTVLDVGACDGNWRRLLPEYRAMDAVEVFGMNLPRLQGYRRVYHTDICDFRYEWYDLIIFGDIIEHLTVEQAQAVLAYAKPRCRDLIIAVPFLYRQGAIYGNPWEVHKQDDLTPELFEERFPGFAVLCDPGHDYRYYHKGGTA
ncbi:MAG: hypothetical protein IKE76_02880 [Clostridia bacterium]|nr:hypothetical protein [Clostridia bacterium]